MKKNVKNHALYIAILSLMYGMIILPSRLHYFLKKKYLLKINNLQKQAKKS